MTSDILFEKVREIETDADVQLEVSLPMIKSSSGKRYYAKLGGTHDQEQYAGEAELLKHISAGAPGICPSVLSCGITEDGRPYFISEYKDLSRLDASSSHKLAVRLSTEMHKTRSPNGKFGFDVPTFCGRTKLSNGWFETWEECYDALIAGLLEGLRSYGNSNLCDRAEEIRKRVIPHLLRPLKIDPVILHGDLWSGNTGTDKLTNEPTIFDPSSFYGHNEADLAIARIFGGFSAEFFATYHEHLPKAEPADQYELRVDLYELFHYLNHALLFGGGGYSSSAQQKMDRLLRSARSFLTCEAFLLVWTIKCYSPAVVRLRVDFSPQFVATYHEQLPEPESASPSELEVDLYWYFNFYLDKEMKSSDM